MLRELLRLRLLRGHREFQPGHRPDGIRGELRNCNLRHDPQAIPRIHRNPLLRTLQPQRTPLVFELLRPKRFARHTRPAHNVCDASDFVDGLLDRVAVDVELLENDYQLLQRHQPDRFFQGLALLQRGDVLGGKQDVVAGLENLIHSRDSRVVEASDFQRFRDRLNSQGDSIEFSRLLLVKRVERDRQQRRDSPGQEKRLRAGEEPGKLKRVIRYLQRLIGIPRRDEQNLPVGFVPDLKHLPEFDSVFRVHHRRGVAVFFAFPDRLEFDFPGEVFPEGLDELLQRHQVLTSHPRNICPFLGVAVVEAVPGNALPTDVLPGDDFEFFNVLSGFGRGSRLAGFGGLEGRVILEPSHATAGDKGFLHCGFQQPIKRRVIPHVSVGEELQQTLAHRGRSFPERIGVVEASLDHRPGDCVVQRRRERLGVAEEDVKGALFPAFGFVKLDSGPGVFPPAFFPLPRGFELLQPAADQRL